MLGIISRLYHDIVNGLSAVEKWIVKLLHAAYAYVDKLFNELRRAVDGVWTALENFGRSIRKFVLQVYAYAKWIVIHGIPDVIKWAEKELVSLTHDIESLGKWALRQLDQLIKDIESAVKGVVSWVITHVFDPLKTDFLTAWHWITHEGALIYDLITHPEKLAALLAHYIWNSWLDLFKKFGPQIARWLVRNLPHEAGMLTDAVERFISNLI